MTTEPMAYIGREPCGCVTFATVDSPEHVRDTAREIGKAMRQGLTIERMTVEAARPLMLAHCPHKKARR